MIAAMSLSPTLAGVWVSSTYWPVMIDDCAITILSLEFCRILLQKYKIKSIFANRKSLNVLDKS